MDREISILFKMYQNLKIKHTLQLLIFIGKLNKYIGDTPHHPFNCHPFYCHDFLICQLLEHPEGNKVGVAKLRIPKNMEKTINFFLYFGQKGQFIFSVTQFLCSVIIRFLALKTISCVLQI